ncbi:MAG TPA: hypothetical protein VF989_06470 [Polyangiaceae bacterium]
MRLLAILAGLAGLLAVLTVQPERATAQPVTLSGRWSASAMRSAWNIGDWGAACGPKPGSEGSPSGTVQIKQSGNELSFSGPGRPFSTAQCWEQFPGLGRVSHAASSRSWRNVCKTAPTDPRQATVVTTLTATDDSISFDETGQYQFVIKGQNCTASARRTRVFRLMEREGQTPTPAASARTVPPPTPAAVAKTTSPEKKAPAERCRERGAPSRIEVRPARKLMRPGETYSFDAVVLDRAGCRLYVTPRWAFASEQTKAKLLGPGKVQVLDSAPEGEVTLTATVAAKSVEVVVEIASKERYEALLQSGAFNASGESEEAAVAAVARGSIGAQETSVEQDSSEQRMRYVAVIGGAALAVGVVGLLLIGRRRRVTSPARPSAVSSAPPPVKPPTRKICPVCGMQYEGESQFCGQDGAQLVPVN